MLLSFLQQLYVSGVCFNPFIHTHTHTLAHTQHRAVYQASLIPILPSSLFRTFRLLLSRCFSSLSPYLSLPLHKLVFWLLRSRIPPSTCLEVVVVVALLLGPITLQSEFGSFLCHFWHLNWFILFICHQHPPLSNPKKTPTFRTLSYLSLSLFVTAPWHTVRDAINSLFEPFSLGGGVFVFIPFGLNLLSLFGLLFFKGRRWAKSHTIFVAFWVCSLFVFSLFLSFFLFSLSLNVDITMAWLVVSDSKWSVFCFFGVLGCSSVP